MDFWPPSGECDDARETVTGGEGDEEDEEGTVRMILFDLSFVLAPGGLGSLAMVARVRRDRRGDIVIA